MEERKAAYRPVYHPQEKVIQQSSWLTSGTFYACLLGAVIIIPWYAWMGDQGNIANSYLDMSGTWFAIFGLVATAGLPSALAQQVEKYNAMSEYKTSQRLFARSLQINLGLGLLTAGAMFLLAPFLASISGGGEDLAVILRYMSAALIVFPVMRGLQGYYQGSQDLFPIGLSQLVWQVLQGIYLLVSSFFILLVFQANFRTAVIQSVFATFIGVAGALIMLLLFWQKEQQHLESLATRSLDKVESSIQVILWEGFLGAMPYVLVGAGLFVYKLMDQLTFIPVMAANTNYSETQLLNLYALFRANPDRVAIIVVAAAGALLLRYLPSLMERVAKQQKREVVRFISIHLQRFSFVMLPVIFWLLLNARSLYTLLYGANALGTRVLIVALITSFVAGFALVMAFLLQSLQQAKPALYYWLGGFVLKGLLQLPLIELLEVYGPYLATILGLVLTSALSYRKIKKTTKSNYQLAFRRFLLILGLVLAGWLLTLGVQQLSYRWLNPDSRLHALLICLITGLFNSGLYVYVTLKIRLAEKLLGAKAKSWRKTLRIK
ncbi:polysaccharide biosynthesis C-terminal domain-containing protein [Enterococcus sp. 669A]|uniref:Polysaccharide biosynthesis C-terminal domain-containing protein n=1 Tax=Candidatus Enterococcus moelleringii TaxID=2815325 RepID=A0ABS3LGI2_9ENTE|nr:polysaccharide biosynthesis C-terminal domain-containing protein [Enterococcus sp. 669A]MBO1308741.1 polysaccharide biosynthesis C-terminal domain-containing protein [Enterococcus sp. 669A]